MLICFGCHLGELETLQYCVTLAASYNCAVDATLASSGCDSADRR